MNIPEFPSEPGFKGEDSFLESLEGCLKTKLDGGQMDDFVLGWKKGSQRGRTYRGEQVLGERRKP